ncbi:protein kinase [Actinoplanes oblitus]|uniref:Protein kinase n=1 Tax=Actinoplanes oblitus TaxID=3040509 RepID=A0ABY8W5C1_9ACTN|nr:protein kinase [Actinoplanes oblitus]WIM93010.1 protein kinase [Actinoplanes oblitus]
MNVDGALEAAERWMSLPRHRNVRICHYAEIVDGHPRLDVEQVDGGPVRDLVDAASPLDRVLDIAIQTAWGVGHAHRHGVAHGDLGAGSVLMTPDGTVKVTGFGVARETARRADVAGVVTLVRELGGPALPVPLAELLDRCLDDGPPVADVAAGLVRMYRQQCGRPYPRPAPQPLPRTSDELSDHGLVLAALGRTEAARSAFGQALALHPGHPEATYNDGLLRWRAGELTDDRLLTALDAIGTGSPPWQGGHLRGEVHLERGDAAAALPLLLEASRAAGDNIQVETAFRYAVHAERPPRPQPRTVRVRPGIRTDSLHGGPGHQVDHVRLSADGRIAVTAGNETVQAWDTRSGRCLSEAHEHAGKASALHITADGRHVLSGARDGTVSWRALRDGQLLRRFRTGEQVVDVWAGDDARTAVITVESRFQVWDLRDGRLLRAIDHDGPIVAAAVSADGRRAVSAGRDHVVRLWDLPTGQCLLRLDGHTSRVHALRLSADGRVAVSAGEYDPVIRVWDLAGGRCRHLLTGHVREARGLAVSPDGRYALSGGGTDHTVRLWELAAGRCLRTFASEYDDTVALSADGRVAAAGGLTGVVRVWDVPAPTGHAAPLQPCRPRSSTEAEALAAAASSILDRAELAIAEERFDAAHALLAGLRTDRRHDRTPRALRAWQRLSARVDRVAVEDVLVARTLGGHTDRVASICAGPDGRIAVSGGRDGTLRVWDLASGECRRTLTGHTGAVLSVAASGDGRTVVSAGRDKTVRVWELDSGRCVRTLTGHDSLVYAVAVSADGRRAVSGARDGDRLLVWDLDSGDSIHRLGGHTGGVPTVAITADGRRAVSGSHDGTARVWDLDTGDCVRVLDASHQGFAVAAVRLGAGGDRVLTVDAGGRARLWDLTSGARPRTFAPDWSGCTDVRLSDDGRYALAAGDRLLRLYDLATGDPAYDLPDRPAEISAVCLSPDGRFVAAACRDTTVRTWELTWRLRPTADRRVLARPLVEESVAQGSNVIGADHEGG